MPLYNEVYNAINQYDRNSLIFYEPVTWGMIFNGSVTGTGFVGVPGNDPHRAVLSWHYYCWFYSASNFSRIACDQDFGPKCFGQIKKDVSRTGGGSFLTEFGDIDPSSAASIQDYNNVMALADANAESWMQWSFQGILESHAWNPPAEWITILSRPYVRAFAGIPISQTFNVTTLVFECCFQLNTSISAPTELYIPSIHYTNPVLTVPANLLSATFRAPTYFITPLSTAPDNSLCCIQLYNT